MYFCKLCPSVGPKERSRQALDRLPLVSNFLTNFWTQYFDGARLSPNSVRNAVWHALNEPVCQYLRTRNPRCSTVYIENILGPLAGTHPVIILWDHRRICGPSLTETSLCGAYLYSKTPLSQCHFVRHKSHTDW